MCLKNRIKVYILCCSTMYVWCRKLYVNSFPKDNFIHELANMFYAKRNT